MNPADLAYAGLARQADLVAEGEVSARELVDATDAHGPPVRADAEVVRRLRAAGAIVVGKTNVPELAILPFTETPTYGKTRNPWDLQRTPGGSSGGSGGAVAAGMAGAALGSDGAGSIRIPAGRCGLFDLKPQRGRVPMAPNTAGWQGLTVLGPITRTVADSARFCDVVKDGGPSFAEAAARAPARLRIAVSTRVPSPRCSPSPPRSRPSAHGPTAGRRTRREA